MRLSSFNARAQKDLASAITRLEGQGAKVRQEGIGGSEGAGGRGGAKGFGGVGGKMKRR